MTCLAQLEKLKLHDSSLSTLIEALIYHHGYSASDLAAAVRAVNNE